LRGERFSRICVGVHFQGRGWREGVIPFTEQTGGYGSLGEGNVKTGFFLLTQRGFGKENYRRG